MTHDRRFRLCPACLTINSDSLCLECRRHLVDVDPATRDAAEAARDAALAKRRSGTLHNGIPADPLLRLTAAHAARYRG